MYAECGPVGRTGRSTTGSRKFPADLLFVAHPASGRVGQAEVVRVEPVGEQGHVGERLPAAGVGDGPFLLKAVECPEIRRDDLADDLRRLTESEPGTFAGSSDPFTPPFFI